MKAEKLQFNPNPIVKYLNKASVDFTKEDIIRFIEHNEIEMVNFHYVAEDGKLKTLNFVISSLQHLDDILSSGERVDGSSLWKQPQNPGFSRSGALARVSIP